MKAAPRLIADNSELKKSPIDFINEDHAEMTQLDTPFVLISAPPKLVSATKERMQLYAKDGFCSALDIKEEKRILGASNLQLKSTNIAGIYQRDSSKTYAKQMHNTIDKLFERAANSRPVLSAKSEITPFSTSAIQLLCKQKKVFYYENVHASIVDDTAKHVPELKSWSFNELRTGNVLFEFHDEGEYAIGVTQSVILVGERDTFSSLHIEDYQLYSINFCLPGSASRQQS